MRRSSWGGWERNYGTTHPEEVRESWRDLVAEQAHVVDEDEEQRRAETDVIAGTPWGSCSSLIRALGLKRRPVPSSSSHVSDMWSVSCAISSLHPQACGTWMWRASAIMTA